MPDDAGLSLDVEFRKLILEDGGGDSSSSAKR
jgi:hypothetical protein